jgi:hypothetical protein
VGLRHFQNKAHRSFWSVHVQAWRQSGLTRTEYCREQRLTKSTFDRWLKALDAWDSLRIEERARRRRAKHPVSTDKRNKAVQAFWAMHVEALNWSGTTAKDYAAAHHLSVYSLRTWRGRLEAQAQAVDWRARLHPSALPQISTRTSSAAKESGDKTVLTNSASADPPRDGRSNRRSFTDEQKRAIVLECERPGATVSAVARAHQLATSVLFRWRAELGYGPRETVKLARVRLADAPPDSVSPGEPGALVLHKLLPKPDGMEEIELADGRRVFAPIGADPETVERHIAERKAAP